MHSKGTGGEENRTEAYDSERHRVAYPFPPFLVEWRRKEFA